MSWIKSSLLFLATILFALPSFSAGLLTPVGQMNALSIQSHQVNVTVEKDVLTVTGERPNLTGDFERQDHEATRFELKVTLHEDLDPANIQATHRDGVLVLSLQKRREIQFRPF